MKLSATEAVDLWKTKDPLELEYTALPSRSELSLKL